MCNGGTIKKKKEITKRRERFTHCVMKVLSVQTVERHVFSAVEGGTAEGEADFLWALSPLSSRSTPRRWLTSASALLPWRALHLFCLSVFDYSPLCFLRLRREALTPKEYVWDRWRAARKTRTTSIFESHLANPPRRLFRSFDNQPFPPPAAAPSVARGVGPSDL